ncbi:hypothetical protein C0J08_14930 [Marinomonas sp. CT5]|uniref:hypothetical protein n=1 Tax=Marinomonas sp. CT5 TaxID=2066133 RepID=UPI001BAFB11A|nr:hypothetical protein [Marinomonas sp. CT5]QUX96613.1 hypothetical protein C0J08_14930 [Marinomonas sp. CT5]
MNTPQETQEIILSDESVIELLSGKVNEKIEAMEAELLTLEQVEMPVEHRFINGMYAREITIPKGTILTGAVHKFDYVDIMLSGDIAVATPDGVKRLKGINIMTGPAGRKRAGYAYEDTRWLTVHKTDATSPEGIEGVLTVRTITEFMNLPVSEKKTAIENKGELLCQ